MLGLLTSILGGGITGIFGTALQRFADYKTEKMKAENELALRKMDMELMAQEWAQRTKIAEVEATAKVDAADAEAFAASFKDSKLYSDATEKNTNQVWVLIILDAIRAIIRPGLTVYLCALTTIIYIKASRLLNGEAILPGMAYELASNIINTVLYLTTTCVLWWFGSRNKSKGPKA